MDKWMEKLSLIKGRQWIILLLILCLSLWWFFSQSSAVPNAMSSEESRISAILSSIEGAGTCRIVIHFSQESTAFGENASTPTGAVIVSQGANDILVRTQLKSAAKTLLGLTDDQVDIFPMEDIP